MSAFAAYADYYDIIYWDKDYRAEAKFIRDLIRRHAPRAHRLLDLGCGTGLHAIELAKLGYRVCGVDMSESMLVRARSRLAGASEAVRGLLEFTQGDARTFSNAQVFDAVVSLFHVMSYQITDADVRGAIATARRHLARGAPFIFDFWHGPAIAQDGPQHREKSIRRDNLEIRRVTKPEWFPADNKVIINYDVSIFDKATGRTEQFSESHAMRYFSVEELAKMLGAGGFEPLEWGEWMTGEPPKPDSFSVYAVARAA